MIDACAVERFRGDLAAALGGQRPNDERLALAVSGGADSMAMLALAAAACRGRVIAATVDHRLRAAAADEARLVTNWCRARGVAHATLPLDRPPGPSGVQEAARAARYDALGSWALAHGARSLATAHHADDQAETFLMRAVRGSGAAGLSGIRARRRLCVEAGELVVVRPLLGWRRAELRALATGAGVPFVDDPGNDDPHYERVRVRRLLAREPWLDAEQLARAARHVGEAQAALDAMGERLWNESRREPGGGILDGEVWLDVADLPREWTRRLTRRALAAVRRERGIVRPAFDPAAAPIEPLLDALDAGASATQAGVWVRPVGTLRHFVAAPPRRGR